MSGLEREVEAVLARDACTGCGLCALLDPAIRMALDDDGQLRPRATAPSRADERAVAVFRDACPGVVVHAPTPPEGAAMHPLLGAHLGMWTAWAADPELRHAGSSGGALTALHAWLLATGRAARVVGAAVDEAAPRRTVPVTIRSREDALRAAGSRYAPVAALDNADALLPGTAVCAKPCEAAALRRAAPTLTGGEVPLLLSFFCAGTPSQRATDALLAEHGVPAHARVDALRYRGRGWPGRFTASAGDAVVSVDYDESWGRTLGPTTRWRCKVCADGIGEAADVVAADAWESDDRGFPAFAEGEGTSALIARTQRGLRAILEAEAAGVLVLGPLQAERLAAAQPLQTARRALLGARALGALLGGRAAPRYPGYGRLLLRSLRTPRLALRTVRGTFARARRAGGRP